MQNFSVNTWCNKIIRWGYYFLFALVPLLFTPWNYELFEYNKMIGVYALTVIIGGAWLVKSISQGEFRIAKTPLDIPILLFLSSQLISSIFSIDPHVSWFGYYSRFNGGMLSIISYVLLYYALVSNFSELGIWNHESWIKKAQNKTEKFQSVIHNSLFIILKVTLAAASTVVLYGLAERFGIDKNLWVQDVQNRVFSSLGQPNWLAAYIVALMPIGMGFALKSQNTELKSQQGNKTFYWSLGSVFWVLIAALFFIVLLFTRSRSGLLGFVAADVVFWGLLFVLSRRPRDNQSLALKSIGVPFFLLHVTFFLIIFINGTSMDSVDKWVTLRAWKTRILTQRSNEVTNPRANKSTPSAYSAPLLETGGTESGTIRKYVWQGAITAWQSSVKTFLIGTGTETFAFAFYQFRPQGHNLTSEWDFLYNKAHNEYLNYLTTTGILGLGSYLLFIGTFIWWFIKSQMNFDSVWNLEFDAWCLRAALFSGWISILVTNFFGFSVVIIQIFLFLFPAIVFIFYQQRNDGTMKQWRILIRLPHWTLWIVSLLIVGLFALVGVTWYADTLYAAGNRASRGGQYDVAVARLSRALLLNPTEPLYADELGSAYAGLVMKVVEEKDATSAAAFMKRSLAASDRAITTSPRNVNFWKTRTKIYYTFSSLDPAYNDAAIEALEHAQELSPNDPKITYNLAILYGRKGDNNKAVDTLKNTITLKPNYRDAYYALWVFYTEVKKPDLARKILEDYLAKVDPGDRDFQEKLRN